MASLFGGAALGLGYAFGRDGDGYFDTTIDRLETDTVAITAEDLTFAAEPGSPDWILDALDTDVRLRATNADATREVFVGIGPEADVEAYLAGVAHDEVIGVNSIRGVEYRTRTGADVIEPPAEQDFWTVSAAGRGTQELDWEAASGRWSVVTMNADGTPGVAVDVNVGAKGTFVLPLALIMLGAGALLAALAAVFIVVGAHDTKRRVETGQAASLEHDAAVATNGAPSHAVHPVGLTARLDPELSRWQWLVKWFLAIPHFIVLAFLWLAFVVLTLVAAVAIVFTGRYPRGIFEFNVGVLRWSWRVSYYASTGGIGTDRYPPFTLDPEPGDAAHLDVAYPDSLSRGLVFVKWLLAIPHLIVVALLAGSSVSWLATDGDGVGFRITGGGGLLSILVLVTGVVLLFTGRYPTALFDLIVGFNRWIFRVIAYVALMTDTYPPFRLDQGGDEPTPAPDPLPEPPVTTPPFDPPAAIDTPADATPSRDREVVST
jgi:hypothetical protein